ncbi:hypothetical protein C8R46DRAFT_1027195 [Mycena filopes]|nr:hypothetical protein C8R46DRAFT_1045821 [Mycena filopes]KAJ7168795.1 hypothetical protein C8R46DRAFT_1033961 [Mycena filopes]KAJ7173158.1 hypothetical protein C8R46DRAFT_1031531 [Mycena filopes]KAJ7183485.1 hypothetical protein C8R46DRAFT_1027195 [Mycena filopes]
MSAEASETVSSILAKVKAEHEADGNGLSKMSQAKRESLDGMRPKIVLKIGKQRETKPASKRSSKKPKPAEKIEPPSSGSFTIDGLVILADGLGPNPVDDTIPSPAAVQILVNLGLAIRKEILISSTATHEDIIDLLSEHLGGPMAYFENIGPTTFTTPTGLTVDAPPFVLLSRVRQRLEVVQVLNPNGEDFFTHRGKHSNVGERLIFLSSRVPIPQSERLAWVTSLAAAFTVQPGHTDSGSDDGQDASKRPKPKPKNKSRKRLSSIALEDSEELIEDLFADEGTARKRQRRVTRQSNADDESTLPFIFTDSIAQEISLSNSSGPSNAVAGPSHSTNATVGPSHSTNATAGPSRLEASATEPIDLTGGTSRSPSPDIPSFMRAPIVTTPTPQAYQLAIDPAFSDPVEEYCYGAGPKPIPKFF